jgi:hypothetical protein
MQTVWYGRETKVDNRLVLKFQNGFIMYSDTLYGKTAEQQQEIQKQFQWVIDDLNAMGIACIGRQVF